MKSWQKLSVLMGVNALGVALGVWIVSEAVYFHQIDSRLIKERQHSQETQIAVICSELGGCIDRLDGVASHVEAIEGATVEFGSKFSSRLDSLSDRSNGQLGVNEQLRIRMDVLALVFEQAKIEAKQRHRHRDGWLRYAFAELSK